MKLDCLYHDAQYYLRRVGPLVNLQAAVSQSYPDTLMVSSF